jgi:hypothetical protein
MIIILLVLNYEQRWLKRVYLNIVSNLLLIFGDQRKEIELCWKRLWLLLMSHIQGHSVSLSKFINTISQKIILHKDLIRTNKIGQLKLILKTEIDMTIFVNEK